MNLYRYYKIYMAQKKKYSVAVIDFVTNGESDLSDDEEFLDN